MYLDDRCNEVKMSLFHNGQMSAPMPLNEACLNRKFFLKKIPNCLSKFETGLLETNVSLVDQLAKRVSQVSLNTD